MPGMREKQAISTINKKIIYEKVINSMKNQEEEKGVGEGL